VLSGDRVERIEQLPSKAPFSKRCEEMVGEACESAAASQVARRFQLPETTVRAIDLRYLERWDRHRRKLALKQLGVDEIYRGKQDKFLTVVSNLETGEPLWFGKERKKETLDEFFRVRCHDKCDCRCFLPQSVRLSVSRYRFILSFGVLTHFRCKRETKTRATLLSSMR
jgi:hypothetical protein